MPCLAIDVPLLPPLPNIFLSAVIPITIPIHIGKVGITCCFFELPPIHISIAITLPGFATAALAAISALEAQINAGLMVLDQIQIPSCNIG